MKFSKSFILLLAAAFTEAFPLEERTLYPISQTNLITSTNGIAEILFSDKTSFLERNHIVKRDLLTTSEILLQHAKDNPPLKDVPGVPNAKYLSVDVLQAGVIFKDGTYKSSSGYPEVEQHQGTLPANAHRIGTDSLTICTGLMLISEEGSLMIHLNPEVCNWFLDPNRTKEQKAKDAKEPNYKELEKRFNRVKSDAKSYFRNLKSKSKSKKFFAAVIKGPNQSDDKYGKWMARELLGVMEDEIVKVASPVDKPANWRFVVADFSHSPPTVSVGGHQMPWNIPKKM